MVDKPITLKEYVMPSMNTTRQDYINDKNRKFGGSSKFSFRKYKTDKERLEEYLRQKEENQKYIERIKGKNSSSEKTEIANKNYYSIEQPIMRYKPRTDLERIYYSINEYSYGKISKDIIDEQLSKLNLNILKKKDEEDHMDNTLLDKYKNLDEKLLEELQTQKEFLNRQGYTEKNSETVKQIELILNAHQQKSAILNKISDKDSNKDEEKINKRKNQIAIKNQINSNAAKKLMGEYHTKTFFKGASVFSLNIDNNKNKISRSVNKNYEISNAGLINEDTSTGFFNNFNSKDYYSNNNLLSNNYAKTNNNFFRQVNSSTTNKTHKDNFDTKEIFKENNKHNYLVFTEKDEPYMDELEELEEKKRSNTLANTSFNNFKVNLPYKNNKKANQPKAISNYKNNSKNNNNDNGLNLNSIDLQDNHLISNIKSYDFNPNLGKKEEKYDIKSLLYLKNISALSTLPSDNVISEENNNKKKEGFLTNLRKKSVQINLNNNENMTLKQIATNDIDDIRKYDEDKITIENETYLKSQIDMISKSVLKRCNFLHNKSDFNNKCLKSGQGKLMMTSGLTINDFAKKYNIPK